MRITIRLPLSATSAAAAGLLALAPSQGASAYTFKTLYSFCKEANCADGANPKAELILDKKGNLYSTTYYGGGANNAGTIFKLTPKGKETVLYAFMGTEDRGHPLAGLVMDKQGYLYGTTERGGGSKLGTVFVFGNGSEDIFHAFTGGMDGANPYASLIMDKDGDLYGTTYYGGGDPGVGTVFKVNKEGETILHFFQSDDNPDGANPYGGVIMDGNGNLYGTTSGGGRAGMGTIFKLTPNGKETLLHEFTGADGNYPAAGLIIDKKGNLYGTTYYGGGGDRGVVFELPVKGKETTLHSFTGTDGGEPSAGLIMDDNGNLFGTTSDGGDASDHGVVFELTSKGKEKVLYAFTGNADGYRPYGGLVRDDNDNLYGTAAFGGASDFGTVFRLAP
jgi:uncharacterized repeat protein (TIGR03803 family)